MLAYYGSHILHTAVAYFNVVLVEKGVIHVIPMMTPSNPVDTQQAFPTTNTDKMIDQVETASVTLSRIILLLTAA